MLINNNHKNTNMFYHGNTYVELVNQFSFDSLKQFKYQIPNDIVKIIGNNYNYEIPIILLNNNCQFIKAAINFNGTNELNLNKLGISDNTIEIILKYVIYDDIDITKDLNNNQFTELLEGLDLLGIPSDQDKYKELCYSFIEYLGLFIIKNKSLLSLDSWEEIVVFVKYVIDIFDYETLLVNIIDFDFYIDLSFSLSSVLFDTFRSNVLKNNFEYKLKHLIILILNECDIDILTNHLLIDLNG